MSKPRAIHTLESLMARTEEVGDCRVWTGYSTNKTPQVHHQGDMVSVRKLILELSGVRVNGQFIGATCGTENCVCPEHIIQRNQKNQAKAMAKKAAERRAERETMHIISRRKRADTKLNLEAVREIRASEESGPILAAKYGVSRTLINKVKRGIYWRDEGNPFAGLFAANDSKKRAA